MPPCVVFLAEKGDSLTWGDFENYDSQEVGSGLYIRQYPDGTVEEAEL